MTSKKNRPPWIPVVAGVIRRGEEVLLGQRPEGPLKGVWEFPGGKIEPGELPEDALNRELKEELAIDAEVGPLLMATTHNYSEVGIVLLFFEVNFWKGQPKPKHHLDLKWFKPAELKKTDLPDANKKVLDRIIKYLKKEPKP